jgi:alpha-L-fucosidase
MGSDPIYLSVPAAGSEVRIKSLGTNGRLGGLVRSVRLLGSTEKLAWSQTVDALVITCPGQMPFATSVCFEVDEESSEKKVK